MPGEPPALALYLVPRLVTGCQTSVLNENVPPPGPALHEQSRPSTTHSSHSLNVRSLNAACFAAGRQSVLQDDYLTLSSLDSSSKAFEPASRSLFHSFSRGRSPSRVTAPRPELATASALRVRGQPSCPDLVPVPLEICERAAKSPARPRCLPHDIFNGHLQPEPASA